MSSEEPSRRAAAKARTGAEKRYCPDCDAVIIPETAAGRRYCPECRLAFGSKSQPPDIARIGLIYSSVGGS